MTKLLLALPDLEGGGAERVFVNLANSFKAKGVQVELLLGEKQGVYFDILDPLIPVHALNAKGLLNYVRAMRSFFRTHKDYTVILSTGEYIVAALALLRKTTLLKTPVVPVLEYDIIPYIPTLPRLNRIWLPLLYSKLILSAPLIITACRGIAINLTKKFGTRNFEVIYNPVVDDTMPEKGMEKVEEDFFKHGYKVIITIGRLTDQKDQTTLLYAFQNVHRQHKYVRLLLLGVGDKEEELKALAHSLQLNDVVHFVGFKKNPYAYLAKSDVFVLSSIFEGFGNVLAEALAMGVNVVSTDCPSGPSEILENGTYGWLSPVKDPAALAQNILKALDQPMPPLVLQKGARRFHIDTISNQYLQVLKKNRLLEGAVGVEE